MAAPTAAATAAPPRGKECERCRVSRAILRRPKNGARLCRECFFDLFEAEVHDVIVTHRLFTRGERVAIGASGGKDSTVLAHVMSTLNKRHDYGLDLVLLSIDEGITGYRDDSLESVKRNAADYGLELAILSYAELYGWSMDNIVAEVGLSGNCTFCGVFRRQALDRGARALRVDKIATGHNADDCAETVLMNLLRGDIARLGRCVAITTGAAGDLPRCKPFKYVYEKEIVMYAYHKKLDYFSTECIYSPQAYRGYAREFIKDVEVARPSVILDIIYSAEAWAVDVDDGGGSAGGGGDSGTAAAATAARTVAAVAGAAATAMPACGAARSACSGATTSGSGCHCGASTACGCTTSCGGGTGVLERAAGGAAAADSDAGVARPVSSSNCGSGAADAIGRSGCACSRGASAAPAAPADIDSSGSTAVSVSAPTVPPVAEGVSVASDAAAVFGASTGVGGGSCRRRQATTAPPTTSATTTRGAQTKLRTFVRVQGSCVRCGYMTSTPGGLCQACNLLARLEAGQPRLDIGMCDDGAPRSDAGSGAAVSAHGGATRKSHADDGAAAAAAAVTVGDRRPLGIPRDAAAAAGGSGVSSATAQAALQRLAESASATLEARRHASGT